MFKQFSVKRLGLLIQTHWLENARLYLLSTASIMGLMAVVFIIQLVTRVRGTPVYTHDFFPVYIFGLIATGAIFTSISCSYLSDKAKSIYWLTLPASHLEKLLTLVFYTLIVFPAIYTLCFLTVKELALISVPKGVLIRNGNLSRNSDLAGEVKIGMFLFLATQSFFLLGGIYFKRFSFVKTAIAGTLCVLFFLLMVNKVSEFIFFYHNSPGRILQWEGFQARQYTNNGLQRLYNYPDWFTKVFISIAKTIWAPVFLVVTWFRLKEKEIK